MSLWSLENCQGWLSFLKGGYVTNRTERDTQSSVTRGLLGQKARLTVVTHDILGNVTRGLWHVTLWHAARDRLFEKIFDRSVAARKDIRQIRASISFSSKSDSFQKWTSRFLHFRDLRFQGVTWLFSSDGFFRKCRNRKFASKKKLILLFSIIICTLFGNNLDSF